MADTNRRPGLDEAVHRLTGQSAATHWGNASVTVRSADIRTVLEALGYECERADRVEHLLAEAPHAYGNCETTAWAGGPVIPCTCWKSEA